MSKYPRGEFHHGLQDRGKIMVGVRFYFGWACIQKDKSDQRQGWNSPQCETMCNVPLKKVFLKISQNSQENNCARHSFRPQTSNFIKIEIRAQVFSCEFCESFKNTVFYRTSLVAASAVNHATCVPLLDKVRSYFAIYKGSFWHKILKNDLK